MKKLTLIFSLFLLSFSVIGCDFFGTPYDKMMNSFEKVIVDKNAIEINIITSMDFLVNYLGIEDSTTTMTMTYFVEQKEVLVSTSMFNQAVELYFAQVGEDLLTYYIDEDRLHPLDTSEVENSVPIDTTMFHLEDFTGKASWESDFEETEEGVFVVEVLLEDLFDDEMFSDIEASFTAAGATLESLVGKKAIITVSYDTNIETLTMLFDMEAFPLTIYNTTYELKIDQVIEISPSSKTPINYNDYHTYPVENVNHINRTYQVNESFEGDLSAGAIGYYKINLPVGHYAFMVQDNSGMFSVHIYDQNMTLMTPNSSKIYEIETAGDYYIKVVSNSNFGYFVMAVVGTQS